MQSSFTSANISKAFWQVPLTEEAKERSAFITYDRIYAWNSMPFGLMNAPATFQALMSQVLRNINWRYVLCYIDDIFVFSPTFEVHLQHLSEVFQRLRDAGLKLTPSKCFFAQKQIRYLGHILSKGGILPDASKFERVQKLPVPKNSSDVKSVLGLFNFYKKFIQGYSKICAPLFGLLQKDKAFVWNDTCQKAFDTLKDSLINATILAYPDMNRPFTLSCDASRSGLGYILGQVGDDKLEHVIAYGGRALRKPEKNYTVTELECLAIVEGIKEYRTYLSSGKFTVYIVHKALKYLQTLRTSNPQGRLARWSMDLKEFDFDVQFRKGVNNQNADALSRLPFQDTEKQTSTKEQPISKLEVPILVSVRDTLLKPQDGTEIVDLVPSLETSVFTSHSAETPVFSTDAVPAKISKSHLTEPIATDTHPEPGDEPFVSSLNAQNAQHEWLKVSF